MLVRFGWNQGFDDITRLRRHSFNGEEACCSLQDCFRDGFGPDVPEGFQQVSSKVGECVAKGGPKCSHGFQGSPIRGVIAPHLPHGCRTAPLKRSEEVHKGGSRKVSQGFQGGFPRGVQGGSGRVSEGFPRVSATAPD